MFIENLSYIATFIVTSGIAVIGILTTYQIYQLYKKPELSSLLYQQIFLFSFFVYGIWGNISLHEILADLNLSVEISNKLMFFIPLIGLPFLIVSWFMLLKFAFNVNGYGLSRSFILSYFSAFFALLFAFIFLIQKKIVLIPENPDVFIVRAIVAFNLIMHIVFFIPFLFQKTNSKLKEISLNKEWIYFYLAGVICYSAALSFFNSFG